VKVKLLCGETLCIEGVYILSLAARWRLVIFTVRTRRRISLNALNMQLDEFQSHYDYKSSLPLPGTNHSHLLVQNFVNSAIVINFYL
jgi:hypothetical protein